MQAWWLLVAVAAVFVVLAVVFLRRAARRRSAVPPPNASPASSPADSTRRWVSPSDDLPRRARHRLDEAHPLARYPVARQRPMRHPRPSTRQESARERRDS
ncbi:hypothetical protein [Amycolatopsis echigonensis]|uniref:Uncharacterized protein n=1 Tax=Amycolatopsis echigonensis TaxID=2576905 RepID=A0A8E1VX71_9PSEU|nr:hypothetical protein [Amycolatopsis echigonensis]MBB2500019.1 hypothetical protein [Amycolatopsis echigonensis]